MAQRYENVTRSKREIMVNNFFGGIAWGLGLTIGLSIVFALLSFILGAINLVPIVGDFVKDVTTYIEVTTGRDYL